MASVSLQLLLDQDLYDRAAAKALNEGGSLDHVVVAWIGQWLENGQPGIPPSTPASVGLQPVAASPAPVAGSYVVKPGESLWSIAEKVYGDGAKYRLIAEANHLDEKRRIYAGMQLTIPALAPAAPPAPMIQPPSPPQAAGQDVAPKAGYPIVPQGLDQIKQVFGNFTYTDSPGSPTGRIEIDSKWVTANIVTAQVPVLGNIQCHKLLVSVFVDVFVALQAQGLAEGLKYWGCFVPRHKMWDSSKELSVHAWGIALDLNADTNAVGTEGTLDPRVVEVFAKHGFFWGGHFGDPMHFQYCLSY